MSKKIIIELTEHEASQLLTALGNVTDWDDQIDSCFSNLREINACLRAENKIREKVNLPTKDHWTKETVKYAKTLQGSKLT